MTTPRRKSRPFRLHAPWAPAGDQPEAIRQLVDGLRAGRRDQVLLGVTGSGKTFTIANVIAETQLPTLVLAPNKTLAAQLYQEYKAFFPDNAVEYFVSYYDYYQPEAYVPATDTFIEKDSSINEEIDKLRHAATRSLLERTDVIIVASVSCIYGIGSPENYYGMMVALRKGEAVARDLVLRKLIDLQYARNDIDFHRGTFRVRGDVLEVYPAHEQDVAVRFEFFGDEIDRVAEFDPITGRVVRDLDGYAIYPASHYVTERERMKLAIAGIRDELRERLQQLRALDKLVEAQRLEQRTSYDLEMLEEMGWCSGIENYSRYLTQREAGQPPPTLIDYFPEDWLLVVDESHIALSQLAAMYRGDRSRKETLVEFGFRLPSALDNRPLKGEEFDARYPRAIHVSATPGEEELRRAGGYVIEQIVRPTGLLDPVVEIRPATVQVDDLLGEVRRTVDKGFRVLVTTLTKRMAEDLSEYLANQDVKVKYLHSDIDTLERVEILRDLRQGVFDVLVGINLLREGLDLPEVGLVAVLDADKEGFLRSTRSLIQTMGRAARNSEGRVILYADKVTRSMQEAIDEAARRREKQAAYNSEHGIVPRSTVRGIGANLVEREEPVADREIAEVAEVMELYGGPEAIGDEIRRIEADMRAAARELEFEKAAQLRDRLKFLRKVALEVA